MAKSNNHSSSEEKYHELFPDDNLKAKAEAFDKIAKKYYYGNFGSTSKSDLDTLMFSIYLERILEKSENDIFSYSDYNLSKWLGITQSRVGSLKVKKELLYPYDKFNWIKSLERISERAIYEDGKIKLFIPDRNLYLEIKNAIEESGGFIEVQLTSNLLQVRLPYFIDLLMAIEANSDSGKSRKEIIDGINKKSVEHNLDFKIMEEQSIGSVLKEQTPEMIVDIISSLIPVFGDSANKIAKLVLSKIRIKIEQSRED